MLGRLFVGMIKGIVVGGLVGFALVKLGMAVPTAIVAYLAAALTGVLIGLIAGKPIWAKDAKIEAGMKAGVGALVGMALLFAARRWLAFPVPPMLLDLTHTTVEPGTDAPTISQFAMTALAGVAAVLGGFYDADNTPEEDKPEAKGEKKPAAKARIAAPPEEEELEDDAAEEPEKKKAKK